MLCYLITKPNIFWIVKSEAQTIQHTQKNDLWTEKQF